MFTPVIFTEHIEHLYILKQFLQFHITYLL